MNHAVLTLPLLLAGCAGAASPGQILPAPSWLALGPEQGWAVEVTPDHIRYSGDYGAVQITEANPGARQAKGGRRFTGRRLTLHITPGPCSNAMSAQRYAESVALTIDGKRLKGCGGAVLPPPSLLGSRWIFIEIDGRAVADPQATELRFAAGQLSASAGCNRLNGPYSITANALAVGPLASTRMACGSDMASQEAALLALFAAPLALSYANDGSMLLSGANGASARLRLRP